MYLLLIKNETGDISKTMKRLSDENVKIPEYKSPEYQDFLSLIFIKKRKHRIKINELLNHKWS